MKRPCGLASVGAIAPSIEQYAGAFPLAGTQRGAASVTALTGSPIADAAMEVPSLAGVHSSAPISFTPGSAAGACALRAPVRIDTTDNEAAAVKDKNTVRERFITLLIIGVRKPHHPACSDRD